MQLHLYRTRTVDYVYVILSHKRTYTTRTVFRKGTYGRMVRRRL